MTHCSRIAAIPSAFLVAMALLFANATTAGAAEQPPEQAILVLDASGSMWGQIDGVNKIVIAREVVGNLFSDWNDSVHLGVMAYGHRTRGACDDIEMVIPIGALNPGQATATVNEINPTGMTPIAGSLQQAAQELRSSENRATVILVSDGLETCEADPCAVATSLEEQGIDFTAHVVGFDLSEEEAAQLQCIADNTGGAFFTASDADELSTALIATQEAVVQTVQADPEPEPAGPRGLQLQARLTPDSPVLTDDLFWWVTAPEADAAGSYEELDLSGAPNPLFELDEGNYRVVVRFGRSRHDAFFDVAADGVTEGEIILDAGYLAAQAIPADGAEPLNDDMFFWVLSENTNLNGDRTELDLAGSATPLFQLPAGNYVLRARHGAAFVDTDVQVTAGERTDVTVNMNVGYVAVQTVMAEGGMPLDDNMFYWILSSTTNLNGNREEIDISGAAMPLFQIPAGDYILRSRFGASFVDTPVTAIAGSRTEITVNQNAGAIRPKAVTAAGGADSGATDIFWRVYAAEENLDGSRDEVLIDGSREPLLLLPAGDYILDVQANGARHTAPVSLAPGQVLDTEVVVPE